MTDGEHQAMTRAHLVPVVSCGNKNYEILKHVKNHRVSKTIKLITFLNLYIYFC